MIGVVTSIGFDIKPKAKQTATTAIRCQVWPRTYLRYASKVSMKKSPLSTSFRSEIQATDSTRNGCMAKMAALIALAQSALVDCHKNVNKSSAAAACKPTLTK